MTTHFRFFLACVFGALLVLLCLSAQAVEQFTPTGKAVTPNTACGAPGVGYGADGHVLAGQHLHDESRTGQRVNADGVWEQCTMPPACRSTVLMVPKRGYSIQPRALPNSHVTKVPRTVLVYGPRGQSDLRGAMTFKCDGTGSQSKTGGWVLVDSAVR